jgi:hypothetical protein
VLRPQRRRYGTGWGGTQSEVAAGAAGGVRFDDARLCRDSRLERVPGVMRGCFDKVSGLGLHRVRADGGPSPKCGSVSCRRVPSGCSGWRGSASVFGGATDTVSGLGLHRVRADGGPSPRRFAQRGDEPHAVASPLVVPGGAGRLRSSVAHRIFGGAKGLVLGVGSHGSARMGARHPVASLKGVTGPMPSRPLGFIRVSVGPGIFGGAMDLVSCSLSWRCVAAEKRELHTSGGWSGAVVVGKQGRDVI